jgi:hypothetical protein
MRTTTGSSDLNGIGAASTFEPCGTDLNGTQPVLRRKGGMTVAAIPAKASGAACNFAMSPT